MKNTLNEDIKRIHEIMGLSLINEQLIPRPLVKNILKNVEGDEVTTLRKIFNLTDGQIDDVMREIDRVGLDNLSDDVLELLARQSIDNVDDFVRFMKAGKLLGSQFDEIAALMFARFDEVPQIPSDVRDNAIKLYRKKLDELGFLDGADEVKNKLVRDFESEFNEKFADRIVRVSADAAAKLESELNDILNKADGYINQLDDVVENMPADIPERKKIQTLWKRIFYSREDIYDEIKRKSDYLNLEEYTKAGSIRNMKPREIEKLLRADMDGMLTPKDVELAKAVSAAQRANYFTAVGSHFSKLPKGVKMAFWTIIATGGSIVSFYSAILRAVIGLVDRGTDWLERSGSQIEGNIISLNNDNVIEHLSSEIGVPTETLENWEIRIDNNKTIAIVENPAPDGKIYRVRLVTYEDEPEKNYIKSEEI